MGNLILSIGLASVVIITGLLLIPVIFKGLSSGNSVSLWVLLTLIFLNVVMPVIFDPVSYRTGGDPNFLATLTSQIAQITLWISGVVLILCWIRRGVKPKGIGVQVLTLYGLLAIISLLLVQDIRVVINSLILAALASCVRVPASEIVTGFRTLFRIVTIGSLTLWLVAPTNANYFLVGGIPRELFGLGQVSGLTAHPNILGPVAAVALLIELRTRKNTGVLGIVAIISALFCVLFAQSRVGWAMAVAGLFILWLFSNPHSKLRIIKIIVVFIGLLIGLYSLFLETANSNYSDITSGRVKMWELLYSFYIDSPFIGNGVNVLAIDNRVRLGRFANVAGQAHNQFVETLIELGLIGLVCLILLLVSVVVFLIRARGEWQALLIAVSVGYFLLMMSETPLRTASNAFVLITMFLIAISSSQATLRRNFNNEQLYNSKHSFQPQYE